MKVDPISILCNIRINSRTVSLTTAESPTRHTCNLSTIRNESLNLQMNLWFCKKNLFQFGTWLSRLRQRRKPLGPPNLLDKYRPLRGEHLQHKAVFYLSLPHLISFCTWNEKNNSRAYRSNDPLALFTKILWTNIKFPNLKTYCFRLTIGIVTWFKRYLLPSVSPHPVIAQTASSCGVKLFSGRQAGFLTVKNGSYSLN